MSMSISNDTKTNQYKSVCEKGTFDRSFFLSFSLSLFGKTPSKNDDITRRCHQCDSITGLTELGFWCV
ncbi:hypothetical protein L1987_65213 [Smallanthus sonchifolius]|uniref:Uncharacterized protein n=1 Tax=Smallanthus sonchifolius TaxID=185202 RepID=A0ACB9BTY5_9ASTR|nr:hypothetical protein L1987_65213 [Smallanthus sonchifolius]